MNWLDGWRRQLSKNQVKLWSVEAVGNITVEARYMELLAHA